jgi:hypothetical protein
MRAMSQIGIIPQEAKDLAVHVALCAQRHKETVEKIKETNNNISELRKEATASIADLRKDLRTIGFFVVGVSGLVSGMPWLTQHMPTILRLMGG